MVAITGYGVPFLEELLPLCAKSDVVLKTLLAIAAASRLDACQSPGSLSSMHPYQSALEEVQRDVSRLTDVDLADTTRLQASISTGILLSFMSFHLPGDLWYLHASRIARLVDHFDLSGLKASRSGLFIIMLIAFFDIEAFSVGKPSPSLKAWLKWDLNQHHTNLVVSQDASTPPFHPFELVTGYPVNLVSLIAIISSYAHSPQHGSNLSPMGEPISPHFVLETEEANQVRMMLEAWEPAPLPPTVPLLQRQALSTGWRTIQKAAIVYHLRGRGFKSNLLLPLPCPIGKSSYAMIEDVLIGIRHLTSLWRSNKITTLNCMAWSLAVIGCECGEPQYQELADEIIDAIETLIKSFGMCHLENLKNILRSLWTLKLQMGAGLEANSLSLEFVATLQGNVVPLF